MNQKLKGAGTVWFAYPKRSSKKYTSEISRDYGWEILGEFEFQAVRSFAVDQDQNAMRFRRVGFIKKMTRNSKFAMTQEGEKRTQNN